MRFTRRLTVAGTLLLLVTSLAAPVAAARPDDPGCWGAATKALAQTGGMGEHSSAQTEPRLGLGNVAKALTSTGNVQDLAPVLLGDPDFCA